MSVCAGCQIEQPFARATHPSMNFCVLQMLCITLSIFSVKNTTPKPSFFNWTWCLGLYLKFTFS